MTDNYEADPSANRFNSVADVVAAAESLAADIKELADGLSSASRASLVAIESPVIGSGNILETDSWPFVSPYGLRSLLDRKVTSELRRSGYSESVPSEEESDFIESSKFYDEDLGEVYGKENVRASFIREITAWTEVFAAHGPGVLVLVELGYLDVVELTLFEDNQRSRAYLNRYIDSSLLGEENRQEGHKPYQWCGRRVVVGGDPEIQSQLPKLTAE